MVDFISEKIPKGSWKFHALVLGLYVAITTPLTWYLCLYSREMNALVDALTNTSNMVALGYAVYIYYLYDRTKEEAIKKAKEKGIEVPNMDEALGIIYAKFKAFDDWLEANKPALKKLETKFASVDLTEMLSSMEEIVGIAKSMQEHGFTKERFEKLIVLFEKVDLDKLIAIMDKWNEASQPLPDPPTEWVDGTVDKTTETVAEEPQEPTPKENEDTSPGLPPLQRRRPPKK